MRAMTWMDLKNVMLRKRGGHKRLHIVLSVYRKYPEKAKL